MPSQVAFAIFSLIVIAAAFRVVTAASVARAAAALVVVLAGMAPLFIMLTAEFVAIVQVLVYVGAVVVLFLFAIMVTRQPMNAADTDADHRFRWPGLVVAVGLFVALWLAIKDAFGRNKIIPQRIGRTSDIGSVLMRDYAIAFEAMSILLLAVLIGAVALARRD